MNKNKRVIHKNDELSLKNFVGEIYFASDVHQVFISIFLNSQVIFKLEHSIDFIFVHNKGSSKSQITFELLKQGVETNIKEIVLTTHNYFFQKKLTIKHLNKKTISNYHFCGIAINKSSLDITAKSIIEKYMSQSEAHQVLKIITDDMARGRGEPGLLIDDFNVKASHGNSIGQISDRDLFYLQTRGISQHEGKWMIIKGHLKTTLATLAQNHQQTILAQLQEQLGGSYGQ